MAPCPPPSAEKKELARKIAKARRHDRQAPQVGRVQAFDQLATALVEHAILYESGALQDKRDAVVASLLAVCNYLEQRGIAAATRAPFMRVITALAERERNRLDMLFCERERASKPLTSIAKLQQTGALAALANHWLEHHRDLTRPKKEQFGEAARRLEGFGLGPISKARIKQAKELVSQEGPDHPAIKTHDTVAHWLKEMSDMFGPKEALAVVLPIVAQCDVIWKD